MEQLSAEEFLVLALSLLGLVLWASSPILEALLGDRGALGSLGIGVALLAHAVYLTRQDFSPPYGMLPRGILVWGALCYLSFRLTPPRKVTPGKKFSKHCTPQLISGRYLSSPFQESKVRLRLWASFEVDPQPCELAICAAAEGRAFYGIFWTSSSAVLTPSVEICCLDINDACRGHYVPRGGTRRDETPLSLAVRNEYRVDADLVTIWTSIYASVGTSGGGVGASAPGVGGGSVSLTKSDLGVEVDMGTFVWRCCRGTAE